MTFTYNANQKKWVGRDFRETVASGSSSVSLPGMKVGFVGEAFDNDGSLLTHPVRR